MFRYLVRFIFVPFCVVSDSLGGAQSLVLRAAKPTLRSSLNWLLNTAVLRRIYASYLVRGYSTSRHLHLGPHPFQHTLAFLNEQGKG